MYSDLRQWHRIRDRILVFGESINSVAKKEVISKVTIRKILQHETPLSYHRAGTQKVVAPRPEKPPRKDTTPKTRAQIAKQRWMELLYELEQKRSPTKDQHVSPESADLFEAIAPTLNSPRRKALTVLAKQHGFSTLQIAQHLGIECRTARSHIRAYEAGGIDQLLHGKTRKLKSDDPDIKSAVFALLHEPPSLSGVNRTTWRMDDLQRVLAEKGHHICDAVLRTVIRESGFRWRSAKVVLTSTDPDYRQKLERIKEILSGLKESERFFSIDEYGPFAVKMKAGRMLVESGVQPTVPQWQKSKGCLIVTAALELSRNQVTHFYSKAKNTTEMIRMAKVLFEEYKDASKLYLSWDAASWHMSKELLAFVNEHNSTCAGNTPTLELAPLPASAQFLNVIESVFSGMSRAIILCSNYPSVDAATAAIDRYFLDRNQHYKDNPKRAGKKIWGLERTPNEFAESNNCKDPRYR